VSSEIIIERFLSETINSRPHVADILTPFLHTSPNTGKPAFFFRQDMAKAHGVFEGILYVIAADYIIYLKIIPS
jgi:hypothetical protein